jgi:acetolactate decarboxylase
LNKKIIIVVAVVLAGLFVLSSLSSILQYNQNVAGDRDVLYQLATFNTFSNGGYAGFMSYSELEKHGDFGIGTFDGLDGEMLAVNGIYYQIPWDGKPRVATGNMEAPYATVTFFDVDQSFAVGGVNYTQLKAEIDSALPSKDAIYAIKVTGTFDFAQTRSPAKQNQPYQPLSVALQNQAVFNLTDVSATAVGFWFPASMDGVDYVGYHLHLITDDASAGGHLLDCIIRNATVEIDQTTRYSLVLP